MEEYIKNYDSYEKSIVYNFGIGAGGIADCIKFFMMLLDTCMKEGTRLYYKRNNIQIEKYIKLKYEKMYIDNPTKSDILRIMYPQEHPQYYHNIQYNFSIPIQDVFYFTNEIKVNSFSLLDYTITRYNSIHLRLGDKYLETDKRFVLCKNDIRDYSEERIFKYIEANIDKNIFFCCDNNEYKLKLKKMYPNIIVTTCNIGHTSLSNTSEKQVLDAITEFYILTNSQSIFCGSRSGFSVIAAQFKKIPIET
jgi:hypothetical protein